MGVGIDAFFSPCCKNPRLVYMNECAPSDSGQGTRGCGIMIYTAPLVTALRIHGWKIGKGMLQKKWKILEKQFHIGSW